MGREFKDQIYEQFARIGKALSSPKRLEILDLLSQGEKSVEVIARQTALTVKNASAHLRELRAARLVETRKEGTYVFYRLASETMFRLLRDLQALGRGRIAEVDRIARQFFTSRDELDPIDARELLRRMEGGEVIVLDVRPEEEYRAGHVPGAWSVPVEDVERIIPELPRDREIVAYCRGPYCVYAATAVELLCSAGLRARRMEEGLPDWRLAGLPVETGEPGPYRVV